MRPPSCTALLTDLPTDSAVSLSSVRAIEDSSYDSMQDIQEASEMGLLRRTRSEQESYRSSRKGLIKKTTLGIDEYLFGFFRRVPFRGILSPSASSIAVSARLTRNYAVKSGDVQFLVVQSARVRNAVLVSEFAIVVDQCAVHDLVVAPHCSPFNLHNRRFPSSDALTWRFCVVPKGVLPI
jgi:hypothetical protein